MLLQFRKLSRGAAAAIILGLVGLAMVLFLVPAGGINPSPTSTVATVDGREITPTQLSRELDLTLRAQRNNGENITQEEAVASGLHTRLLESMVGRNALFAYAEKRGVSASDAQVAEYIRGIPSVVNPISGAFDQAAYDQFLSQMQYSRPEFEGDVRSEITTQMLMSALVAGVRAPSSYGALAFAYQTETRVVSIADAPASVAGSIPAPNEVQLQTLWEESQEQLRIPEFRALTLVFARPEDFMARINVPEQRLRDEFDARSASLTQPEKRSYVRLVAQTEAQATDAAARINRGEAPEAVATALGMQITRGAEQARSEVPDTRVAEAVFTQARGQARAVQGQLIPWAVVRVDAITAAVAPTFAAQRDEIRNAIAAEEAADLLNAAIGTFEDARAGGLSVADAARQSGLSIVSVPSVEAGGRAPDGRPIEMFAEQEDLLAVAFETPEGEASDFMPIENVDVLVAVDRIIPASVRPLSEVRDQLVQVYSARELGRRLRERGNQVVEGVRGGQTFAQAARANGFTIRVSSQPLDRQRAAQLPARGLPTQIFAATEGAVVTDMRADQPGILVVQVESINRVDPATAPQVVEAARAQLEEGIGASFSEALQAEVVAGANIRRNEDQLARMFPAAPGDEQAQ